MDRIACPECLGVFRTIYQEGKKERCPYCGRVVTHSDRLRGVVVNEWRAEDGRFPEWVQTNLALINTWWAGQQGDTDIHAIEVLIARLEVINRGAAGMLRRLQEHLPEHISDKPTSNRE